MQTDSAHKAQYINELSAEFDAFCQERHDSGTSNYGPLAFLGNDMFQYMYEEIADLANYARYLYVKMRMLEDLTGGDHGDETQQGEEGSEEASSGTGEQT